MDAAGDQDLKLQKSSPEFIAELQQSLPRFLWKSKTDASDSKHTGGVRRLVRASKTDQLIKLLEPFQEWPQLLDPHLSNLLQPLVNAFIEYLTDHAAQYGSGKPSSDDVIPLPRAICKILYVFCKVRGQKVIVRFLTNEPKYLEPMLDALESWNEPKASIDGCTPSHQGSMVWEERYILLCWLSHLLLAPFDLDSMSSLSSGKALSSSSLQIDLPDDTAPIARRLVRVSMAYLSNASKEREAASMLLARIALRPDLQSIGLPETLVREAIHVLNGAQSAPTSIYTEIGMLSFLTRLIRSAEDLAELKLMTPIYFFFAIIMLEPSNSPGGLVSSTLARRLLIKSSCALVLARTKNPAQRKGALRAVEETMDYLLLALEEPDTSVRIAASKAVSRITLHLGDNGEACVDALISLTYDDDITRWQDPLTGQIITRDDLRAQDIDSFKSLPRSFKPDYRNVDAMKWHGCILAFSQFFYHGSVGASQFSEVLRMVADALHFEQRSSLGVSVGANVRDAACFGLWALARRYSYREICEVKVYGSVFKDGEVLIDISILQSLANDLVCVATLDPSGNIRRGASAALQEMVGRHPDIIHRGIQLIQVVDYNAIALRSKAMSNVAINAAGIDDIYWKAILQGLLSWRGLGSPDAESRRSAAVAIGQLTVKIDRQFVRPESFTKVYDELRRTPFHKVDLRHGLILALGQIVLALLERTLECVKHVVQDLPSESFRVFVVSKDKMAELWHIFYFDDAAHMSTPLDEVSLRMGSMRSSLRTELILEAVLRLISILADSAMFKECEPENRGCGIVPQPSVVDLDVCIEVIELGLRKTDTVVIEATAEAAKSVFQILDPPARENLARKWIARLEPGGQGPRSDQAGVITTLGAIFMRFSNIADESVWTLESELSEKYDRHVYESTSQDVKQWLNEPERGPQSPSSMQMLIIDTLLGQLSTANSIDQRCTTLKSLTSGILNFQVVTDEILDATYASLSDYTINEQGDVGSLVRVEAIKAVAMLISRCSLEENDTKKFEAGIAGLAAEKLDKVRWRAWNCLEPYLSKYLLEDDSVIAIPDMAQTSSKGYFGMLLLMTSYSWMTKPIFEGYITSAGAGSEAIVQASRAALIVYVADLELERWVQYRSKLLPAVMEIFEENLKNDRLLLPTLSFLAFLLSARVIQPQDTETDLWRSFFANLQKAHFKSANIPKIEAAIKIYAALVDFPPLRKAILKKVCQMLVHPYARVRNAAADALFLVSGDRRMMGVEWGKRPRELADEVCKVRAGLGVEA